MHVCTKTTLAQAAAKCADYQVIFMISELSLQCTLEFLMPQEYRSCVL